MNIDNQSLDNPVMAALAAAAVGGTGGGIYGAGSGGLDGAIRGAGQGITQGGALGAGGALGRYLGKNLGRRGGNIGALGGGIGSYLLAKALFAPSNRIKELQEKHKLIKLEDKERAMNRSGADEEEAALAELKGAAGGIKISSYVSLTGLPALFSR